jgi:hypothetical protein
MATELATVLASRKCACRLELDDGAGRPHQGVLYGRDCRAGGAWMQRPEMRRNLSGLRGGLQFW